MSGVVKRAIERVRGDADANEPVEFLDEQRTRDRAQFCLFLLTLILAEQEEIIAEFKRQSRITIQRFRIASGALFFVILILCASF